MEICFVPDNDYGKFLRGGETRRQTSRRHAWTPRAASSGEHDGIEFYTIGQRRGLGISSKDPLYVVELDPAADRVVVGDEFQLSRDAFTVANCNWIPWETPPARFECSAKIRSQPRRRRRAP
jgi:tRNA-specific 2-thiouridylase